MLGSLARKLRALGFDTEYYKSGNDAELKRLASATGRVILTSDRALASLALARGAKAILVTGNNDRQRILSLKAGATRLRVPLARGDPLCSMCGGRLERVARSDVEGIVPQSVQKRHRLFYACTSCGHLYWRGSHWKRLRSLAKLLESS